MFIIEVECRAPIAKIECVRALAMFEPEIADQFLSIALSIEMHDPEEGEAVTIFPPEVLTHTEKAPANPEDTASHARSMGRKPDRTQ